MKEKRTTKTVSIVIFLFTIVTSKAQDSLYKHMSIGIQIGDPIGLTVQYQYGNNKALDFSFGPDYFGSPRLQIDNVKQFNSFLSTIVKTYAGGGLAVAFAKGRTDMFYSKEPGNETFTHLEDNGFQLGARAIFGLTIMPPKLPLYFFVETGPLFALGRIFDLDLDAAIGFRIKLKA